MPTAHGTLRVGPAWRDSAATRRRSSASASCALWGSATARSRGSSPVGTSAAAGAVSTATRCPSRRPALTCGPRSSPSARTPSSAIGRPPRCWGCGRSTFHAIEVTVVGGHTPRRPGLIVHRTRVEAVRADLRASAGLRHSSVSRMLFEQAVHEDEPELRRLLAESARRSSAEPRSTRSAAGTSSAPARGETPAGRPRALQPTYRRGCLGLRARLRRLAVDPPGHPAAVAQHPARALGDRLLLARLAGGAGDRRRAVPSHPRTNWSATGARTPGCSATATGSCGSRASASSSTAAACSNDLRALLSRRDAAP